MIISVDKFWDKRLPVNTKDIFVKMFNQSITYHYSSESGVIVESNNDFVRINTMHYKQGYETYLFAYLIVYRKALRDSVYQISKQRMFTASGVSDIALKMIVPLNVLNYCICEKSMKFDELVKVFNIPEKCLSRVLKLYNIT